MLGQVRSPKYLALTAFLLGACASNPSPTTQSASNPVTTQASNIYYTPIRGQYALPDRVAFKQKDPRWSQVRLGGSNEPLESDGCLVTAVAMSLANLGFDTNPGVLTEQLKKVDGFTSRGWLIWAGIERATNGQAKAIYHDEVNETLIDQCMQDGYYPLASFDLPNGRTHWAVILRKSDLGYHMRDPLHPSRQPLIFGQGVGAFKALRCVGLNRT